jgi:hypothetical protein
VIADLQRCGHAVERWPALTREKGRLFGAADPRRQSGMMVW